MKIYNPFHLTPTHFHIPLNHNPKPINYYTYLLTYLLTYSMVQSPS